MSTVEKKPYIHLSIDDTFEIFKDLAQNAMYYSSIFENPYLHFLEMLHTQYGLVASMYCFTEEGDFSLSNVPDIFCPDFTKSADWLKWGFHGRSQNSRYQYASGRKAQKDYSFAIRELLRITGSVRCIDVAPRLHFFAGTWECIRAMCQSDHGLKGLFSADDDRLSYYLDSTQSIPSVQGTYNTYIDLTKYVPTWRGHTFIGWYTERSLMNKVSGVYLTKDMTVYALWRVDENPNTGANPFTDVSEKDWFYGDVMFVYENGLMLGTSKTLFSPHGTATRGMMATILWRMEGSPAPKGKNSFTDVEAGKWYADAITWTAENGIFAGYGKDKFGPDDPITREQLAAIFYRYADYKGYDLTVKGNLDKFKDSDKITDYAKTAMQWAVGSGLVKGKSGNLLDPQGTATRAEIAAMLHRFIEKYELVQGKAPGGLMGWIDPKRLQIPKTGDSSVLGLWGISLCTSLAGCLVLTTWQIRRRREEEALQIIEK